jgi:hypothetical protein
MNAEALYLFLSRVEEEIGQTTDILASASIKTMEDQKYYLGKLDALRIIETAFKKEFKECLLFNNNKQFKGVYNARVNYQ